MVVSCLLRSIWVIYMDVVYGVFAGAKNGDWCRLILTPSKKF